MDSRNQTFTRSFLEVSEVAASVMSHAWKTNNWEVSDYQSYCHRTIVACHWFQDQNLEPNSHVLFFLKTSAEFFELDLACLFLSIIPVSIDSKVNLDSLEYIILITNAQLIVTDNMNLWGRLLEISKRFGIRIAKIYEYRNFKHSYNYKKENVRRMLSKLDDKITPDQVLTVVFTSGSIRKPKGVVITHKQMLSGLVSWMSTWPVLSKEQVGLSYLPMAHIAERVLSYYIPLVKPVSIYICPNPRMVFDYLKEVRPTIFFSVPKLWSELLISYRYKGSKGTLNPLDKLGLNKVELALSGGAPISSQIIKRFRRFGLEIYRAYGLTETSAPIVFSNKNHPIDSIGKPVPGTQIQISHTKELLCKSNGLFKEYLGESELTQGALDPEGWFRTGDIVRKNSDGSLSLIGRKGSIFSLGNGKNIDVSYIEDTIVQHKAFDYVICVGYARSTLLIIIVLDRVFVADWSKKNKISVHNSFLSDKLLNYCKNQCKRILEEVPKWMRPTRLGILPNFWNEHSEFLSPTFKVRRRAFERNYQDFIDSIYRENRYEI